jgi:hypothetical protein
MLLQHFSEDRLVTRMSASRNTLCDVLIFAQRILVQTPCDQ